MRLNVKHLVPILLLLFISSGINAQWDTTWTQTYGGNRDDNANDIILTPDSGFLLVGSTSSFGFDNSQMYFLKLDSNGGIMWSKSHGGDGQESGTSVIQTSDGGFLAVGYTNSWGEGGFDVFMVKLDANGNLEYEEVKGGLDWDFAWDVIEPSPGKFVVAAETQSFGNGNTDGWLLQFDEATRSWDWETTIGTAATENFKAVSKGANNDFFVTGMGYNVTPSDTDIMVVRFNLTGDSIWAKFYGDTLKDFGNDIIKMNDGNYGITGLRSIEGQNPGIAVLKIDSLGDIVFDTSWAASNFEYSEGYKVLEIPTSRMCISGTITKFSGNSDMYLAYTYPGIEYFEHGNTHGRNFLDWGTSALYLNNQGFIIAGHTDGYDNSFLDILTVKTDMLINLDQPNQFQFNEDSVNITGVEPAFYNNSNFLYNTSSNTISIDNSNTYDFFIVDLLGREVTKGKFNSSLNLQDISLNTGMYIINIYSTDNYWNSIIYKND